MTSGLQTTFRVLAETDTDAAGRVLIAALGSSEPAIQAEALRAALDRRNPSVQREIIRRWDRLDENWKALVRHKADRMTRALRDAILGQDPPMCINGCDAAVGLRQYDLIPAMLNALGDQVDFTSDQIAATLLGLAEQLYRELAQPEEEGNRRDPQLIRQHVLGSLETGVQRYVRHRRREVIEAFLMLVNRENVTLKQVLQDPHHSSYQVLVEVLTNSDRPGVIRLLLSFLDDPHAPSAALALVGNRADPAYLRFLLRKIGKEPAAGVRQNLKRINSIGWLRSAPCYLDEWDDDNQHAAVRFILGTNVPRPQAFEVIEYLLQHGKPGGRRAAALGLEEFRGAEANTLALDALDDPDPQVQAAVAPQLRRRGIPGILARLVELLESRHSVVRQAARKSLSEFSFKRFLAAFDMLDEELRHSTGALVKKVDPQVVPLLRVELLAPVRGRRLRALSMLRALDCVPVLESEVLELMQDEDHLVRCEAAGLLAACSSEPSRKALETALADRSQTVQEAAKKSLELRNQFQQWRSDLADPRD